MKREKAPLLEGVCFTSVEQTQNYGVLEQKQDHIVDTTLEEGGYEDHGAHEAQPFMATQVDDSGLGGTKFPYEKVIPETQPPPLPGRSAEEEEEEEEIGRDGGGGGGGDALALATARGAARARAREAALHGRMRRRAGEWARAQEILSRSRERQFSEGLSSRLWYPVLFCCTCRTARRLWLFSRGWRTSYKAESSKLVDTHISSQLLLEEIEYQYQEDNLDVSGQNLTSPGELVQDQTAKSGQPAEKQDACGGLHNSTTFADVNLPSNGLGWSRNEVNKRSTAGGYCSLDSDQSMRISPAGRQHPSLVSQGSSLSATERAKDEERRIREKLKMGAQQAKNRDRRLRHSISRASDLLHRKATQKFVQPLPSTLENKYDTCRNNKYTSL